MSKYSPNTQQNSTMQSLLTVKEILNTDNGMYDIVYSGQKCASSMQMPHVKKEQH